MDVNSLINQATTGTENLEDQTKTTTGGGFEFETPPAGPTPARLVGYVEVGKRKQKPYQGKEKPDAEEVRLYFELNGPKHQKEVDTEEGKKTFTNVVSVKLTKKLNEKAGFSKLFKKMTYGRDSITHMAQMLGEGFLITVIHNTESNPKEGQKARVFANIKDDDGNWQVGAPSYTDPLTGDSHDVPVPAVTQPIKLLLWNNPTNEQWDSIFIDGTRTVKDEKGQEREVSKNWLQMDIVENAINFDGSALQALLGGVADLSLDEEPEDSKEIADESPEPEAKPEPEVKEKAPEKEPAPEPEEKPSDDADDVMASLGLK